MRMKLLAVLILLAAGLPVEAQLKDRFEVVSARTSLPSSIENSTAVALKRVNPELLIAERRYREASAVYTTQIQRAHDQNDMKQLNQACMGLFRTLSLSKSLDSNPDAFSLCRSEELDALFAHVNRNPMFLTYPVFEPSLSWINTADPGRTYNVQVRFDINEYGRAENFDFLQHEGYYLSYPVLSALKQSKYLPAVKDGKPVRSTNNFIQVTFCLERGVRCEAAKAD